MISFWDIFSGEQKGESRRPVLTLILYSLACSSFTSFLGEIRISGVEEGEDEFGEQ